MEDEAIRRPIKLRGSWAEQVEEAETPHEIINRGAGPAIPAAVQDDYRTLRNAECKKSRYTVRLESLNRYIGLGVTPRSHTLNVDPMFGVEDDNFMSEWEEVKRRTEVELTNLLVRRAQIVIGECDASISAAARKVAEKCTQDNQVDEVSTALLAVKQKVSRQEKQFHAERLTRDRELHRLRLEKSAKKTQSQQQGRSGNARRGGQTRQPQNQRQQGRQQARGRQQNGARGRGGPQRDPSRGRNNNRGRRDTLKEMADLMDQMKRM